ncbi:MAG TPA: type II secretion system F family protein [Streptosporangiaceae bacterium]
MSAVAAALCAALAAALVSHGTPSAGHRLAALLPRGAPLAAEPSQGPQAQEVAEGAQDDRRAARMRRGVAALAGVACAVLLGGLPGALAGAGVALVCARLLSKLEPRAVRKRRARLIADLPVAIDLMAACLRGGSSWAESVEAVATALGGPLGTELRRVAAQIRLGADPVATWMALAAEPAMASLARTAARASDSGSALAPTLARLAQDQRRTARAEASARAQAAGVRAVAPLGLCFLPAFVLIGIVPAIAGIAAEVFLP